MKLLQNKFVHIGLFSAIILLACIRCFYFMQYNKNPETNKPYQEQTAIEKWKSNNLITQSKLNGYDEQMWTSVSITSYHMYFKNYVRPTKELDNWFGTHAYKQKLNVFEGRVLGITNQGVIPMDGHILNKVEAGNWVTVSKDGSVNRLKVDSLQFPYDHITLDTGKSQINCIVKYDTTLFERKNFQWFDRDTWTFGWKAPNLGKYVMGWWIQTFAKTKPDPKGYFEFLVPWPEVDATKTNHEPSTKVSPAPYAYSPAEYQKLAKQPNAILTILVIAAIFITGWKFFHFWVGFISASWLVFNKTFIAVNSAIGLDSFAVAFSTFAFLLLLYTIKSIFNNDKWWKIILWSLATGLVSCFALSSKLNAGMVIISELAVFAIIGLITLAKSIGLKSLKPNVRFAPVWKVSVAAILTGIITVLLFIKLNPQVKEGSVVNIMGSKKRIQAMSGSIDEYFDRRARIFTSNQFNDKLKAIGEEITLLSKTPGVDMQQLASVNQQATVASQTMNQDAQRSAMGGRQKENEFYINKFDKYIQDIHKIQAQLKKMDANYQPKTEFINWVKVKHSWPAAFGLVVKRIAVVDPDQPDRYYGTFGNILLMKYNFLDGLFSVLGVIFCIGLAWKQWKEKKQFYTYGILLVSFLLLFYGNVDFVWQDWARYMTPIFPLYSLMIAIGLFELVKFIRTKMVASKQKTSQPVKSKN